MSVWYCSCGATLKVPSVYEVGAISAARAIRAAGWRLSRNAWWVCGACAREVELDDPSEEARRKLTYQ